MINRDRKKPIKFQIRMELDLNEALDEYARKQRVPKALLVRNVLWMYCEQQRRKQP